MVEPEVAEVLGAKVALAGEQVAMVGVGVLGAGDNGNGGNEGRNGSGGREGGEHLMPSSGKRIEKQ